MPVLNEENDRAFHLIIGQVITALVWSLREGRAPTKQERQQILEWLERAEELIPPR